ncbi:MAG: LptF/LptG family permease [Fimbriimonas sp.]|nr:LptF/LptG family permease [Fimbriimonas sp.]
MKKLDIYIVRELIVPFLIGTLSVVLMFQANTYIALAKMYNLENIPTKAVFQFILDQTPTYLNMTLPVGMSLAASLAISRLARESELTAMRAAGTKILRVILPIVVFGCFVAIGNFYLVEKVLPNATKAANRIGMEIGILGLQPNMKTNAIINLRQYAASFGLVERNGDDLSIKKVLLVEQPESDSTAFTTAKSATYHNGIWTFHDAYYRVVKGMELQVFRALSDFTINEKIVPGDMFSPPQGEEMTIGELQDSITAGKKVGSNTKRYEVMLHEKFSVPAACILFALIGPVFAIYFARSGGFVGVLLSIILVLLYYNAFVISTEILSKIPQVPGWLAAWLPNLIFAVIGVFAIRRLE